CRSGQAPRSSPRPLPAAAARSRSNRDRRRAATCGADRLLRGERGVAALAMQGAGAAEHALRHYIGQGHRAQIEMDLVAELFPEIMSEAACLAAAAADRRARRAARGADRLVDRKDDIGDARLVGAVAQKIAAARAAHALD